MGKKKVSNAARKARSEKRRARKKTARGDAPSGKNAAVLAAMIGGAGLEPITPALIDAMVTSGRWTAEEAENARTLAGEGFQYHRGRNSFFAPTEFVGGMFGDDEYGEEPFVDGEGVVHDPDLYAAELGRRLGALIETPTGEGTLSFDEALAHVGAAKAAAVAAYTFLPRHKKGAVVGGQLHIVHYAPESEEEPEEYAPVYVEYVAGDFGDSVGEEDGYEPAEAPSEVRGARFRLTEHYAPGITSYLPEYVLLMLSGVSEEVAHQRLD